MKKCTSPTLGFLLMLLTALPADAAEVCETPRADSSDIVTVTGVLTREEHFGPPNYGDTPETDSREMAMILIPDAAFPAAIPFMQETPEQLLVDRMQLSDPDVRGVWFPDGSHVVVTGRLFSSINGHHHTRILMDVDALEQSPGIVAASCRPG